MSPSNVKNLQTGVPIRFAPQKMTASTKLPRSSANNHDLLCVALNSVFTILGNARSRLLSAVPLWTQINSTLNRRR
jgi:hypothetical protein